MKLRSRRSFNKKGVTSLIFEIKPIVYACGCYGSMCRGARFPGTGVTDACELPCGCWKSNQGCLQDPSGLLATESSLQPQEKSFKKCNSWFFQGSQALRTNQKTFLLVAYFNKSSPTQHLKVILSFLPR